jgi:TolB-like protein/class 3 adenylate cyclase/cytochrome c-type biogenesis protein CcmH/NrfG
LGPRTDAEPVLAHVLFMDIIGCSKLASDQQKRIVGRLQELVRQSAEFQGSRENDELISLPTGDGMALAFFNKLDAAVRCAIEITTSIQAESLCQIRMGVHTGPVFVMEDINGKRNISGAGINRAERVMSCGDEGHILVSDNAADSLRHLSAWRDKILNVGECQVKDGWIHVWNLVDGPIGNPELPRKSKRYFHRRRLALATGAAALILLVAAGVAGAFWMGRMGTTSRSPQDRASIAVLPFADLSPEKNQEYFSEGLAEELLDGLAKTPGLRVAGRTSSFQFRDKTDDFGVIGKKLNVSTILEGSVRKQGNRARIATQLIKATDGFTLWSDTYEREMTDIFAVQKEIALAVTGSLKLTLLGDKAGAQSTNTNPQAYNAYLQGRYFLERRTQANAAKAISYFEQAIKLDPSYAKAYALLGEAHSRQAVTVDADTEEGFRKAREAVERALVLDPELGDAHSAMGWIQQFHDWDWSGADKSYKRALALEPGDSDVIGHSGILARFLGRLDEATALARRAIQIDPLSPGAYYDAGLTFYYAGRTEEAIAAFRKVMELVPEREIVHSFLGRVYLARSQPQQALIEMKKEAHPAFRPFGQALAYHALGRKKESDANLAEFIDKFQAGGEYFIAEIYGFRGETERAFEWLERAYAGHQIALVNLKGDPLLKSLERDPRYTVLLKKMRL